ncbi:hypothetical protein GEO21_22170 [Sphingobacterium faecium]|nr:hypothetical protein [Sphingobacterium faecium]
MNVMERAQAPTPKFFKVLRNIGIVAATIGGAILTAPVALPAAIVTFGGYLAVAGGVISAISQVTVDDKRLKNDADAEGVNHE